MEMRLWQEQSLKLTMSPGLSQAISLLQYSSSEILSFLQERAVENPLIEIEGQERIYSSFSHSTKETGKDALDLIASPDQTLTHFLLEQLGYLNLPRFEKEIAAFVIESLDDNGYLTETDEAIAAHFSMLPEEIKQIVKLVQQMEPSGIAAHNLPECLCLQLEQKGMLTPAAAEVLTNHFEDFAYKKWNKIVKKRLITIQELQEIQEAILTLNPKPGQAYKTENNAIIVPDYTVQVQKRELVLISNQSLSTRVLIDKSYEGILTKKEDMEMHSYLQEKYKEFQWIAKGLETRAITVNNIMTSLLKCQRDFFLRGPQHLKPMMMKELAAEIDVHESTISRAVRNKYVQTPFGTFCLRSFFTASTQGVHKEKVSSSQVKLLIKQIIENENKSNPLSDQQIMFELTKQGFQVSRRTVAKYREQLKIFPSSKRKSFDVRVNT